MRELIHDKRDSYDFANNFESGVRKSEHTDWPKSEKRDKENERFVGPILSSDPKEEADDECGNIEQFHQRVEQTWKVLDRFNT